MKRRILPLLLVPALILPLCACSNGGTQGNPLSAAKTEYSETVAYANLACNGVSLSETQAGHVLKNSTASLTFSPDQSGLASLQSLQTEEILLQNTFRTLLTAEDGTVWQITGGEEHTEQGRYGISHRREGEDAEAPAKREDAEALKTYDLTEEAKTFAALANQVTQTDTERGLHVVSPGKQRSQFGARDLGLDLGEHGRYDLSVTLRGEGISGISVFFATDTTPLTEETNLGTLSLEDSEQFVTITAQIDHEAWNGLLETLLFRLPEGEEGWIEISQIALLAADGRRDEGVSDTLWTVYSDRIYFSQTLSPSEQRYTKAVTEVSLNRRTCLQVLESEDAIALKMIDGSLLGFVRPTGGAVAQVDSGNGTLTVRFTWDLEQDEPMLAFRVYLNYTASASELTTLAAQERDPLTESDFSLKGASLERYDPRGGIYRLTPTDREITVTVKPNGRTVYFFVPPAEGTVWILSDADGAPLPVFAGTTFPVCSQSESVTFRLLPENEPEPIEIPDFFPTEGLERIGEETSLLNGLCTQNTIRYRSVDGTYSVTLTATRLSQDGATIYDIRYDFLARKHVSDLRNAFPFFTFCLEYGFERYCYWSSDGELVQKNAGEEEYAQLGSMPFLTLSADTEAEGWLITKCAATSEGITSTALPILRYEEISEQGTNKLCLTFDAQKVNFVLGDTLVAQVLQLGTDDAETIKALRDSGNYRLIQTQQKSDAPFRVLGMEETTIVRIEGFADYKFPKLTLDGEEYAPSYHVYLDENGLYGFAFPAKTGAEIRIP